MSYFTILLVVTLVVLCGLTTYALLKKQELTEQIAALQDELDTLGLQHSVEVEALKKQLATLERFKHIPDVLERARKTESQIKSKIEQAELRAVEIVRQASEQAAEKAQIAERQLEEQLAQAKGKLSGLKAEIKEKRQKADDTLNKATVYASEIIQAAETKAKEKGGKAYEALAKSEYYASLATAMRNAVDGYGDRYLKPTPSVLDEWAGEFAFHEAGTKLGLARDRSRIMESNHKAATCEYVESNRRQTAVNFVLDAFKGKVDSILSRVKNNNFGTLEQEIKDAYALVNFNGSAFRDARITDGFLEAKLDELKWAVVIQDLRLKEREEQRAIKERIREEQKAQREYERAIRQAQRDEEILKRAMDKVRQEYEAASGEERAKYEAKYQEMNAKLIAFEEKKRALSEAQKTRSGHVYVISNIGSFGEDVYKIGMTRRIEPLDRVRELGDASVPFSFDVHALINSDDAPALESMLHKRFLYHQVNKANRRKEFFKVGLSDIRKLVEEVKHDEEVNHDVKIKKDVIWTLTAEAREYRETQAIEQRIKDEPEFRKRWVEDQMRYDPLAELDEEAAEDEGLAGSEAAAPARPSPAEFVPTAPRDDVLSD